MADTDQFIQLFRAGWIVLTRWSCFHCGLWQIEARQTDHAAIQVDLVHNEIG